MEKVLDVNEVVVEMKYCLFGGFKLLFMYDVLVYVIDVMGFEMYMVWFKDLNMNEFLDDVFEGCAGGVSWGGGVNREVYYSTMDDVYCLDKVWCYIMGML